MELLRNLLPGAPNSEPLHFSLGSMQGAAGFEARDRFKRELRDRPLHFVQNFRELLAEDMEVDVQGLEPAALRGFFQRRLNFGRHRLLSHVGQLFARFWELAEQGRPAELQAAIAAGAAFLEQAVLSNGRLEVAWLLTGLSEPRPGDTTAGAPPQNPGASLLAPRWLAANLAFLRDLDFLRGRISASAGVQRPPPAGCLPRPGRAAAAELPSSRSSGP